MVHLFLECDRKGRILWMNAKARERLGEASNLFDSFDAAAELAPFLENCGNAGPIDGLFLRRAGTPVPVELSCVLRRTARLLVAVRMKERASDRTREADPLVALRCRTLENYFRLFRAQQALDSRLGHGTRNPTDIANELLDRERARLARELHTGAGQALSAIKIHVELIQGTAPELPPQIRTFLDRIADLARDAAAEVRAVSRRLHPPEWQRRGLEDALRKLWHTSGIPEHFQASLNIALASEPPHPVRLALYRIAQESISNVMRHSGATRLSLSLTESAGCITLRVEDNGHGFDPGEEPRSDGLGLRAIRDLARNLDGEVRLSSGADGTTLEVTIPLESGDE
jgi:signal transduction histidine kinase